MGTLKNYFSSDLNATLRIKATRNSSFEVVFGLFPKVNCYRIFGKLESDYYQYPLALIVLFKSRLRKN